MMVNGKVYQSSPNLLFTASQWQELEYQALVFKFMVSGVPIPAHLISTVMTFPFSSSPSSLLHQQQPPPTIGWGPFQVGYGKKIDPEPGRCRRTDGKKWRCSKDAHFDSKYCEKHMHRGKNKNKKQVDTFQTKTSTINFMPSSTPTTPSQNVTIAGFAASPAVSSVSFASSPPSSSSSHASPYPFLSPHSQQSPADCFTLSTDNHSTYLRLQGNLDYVYENKA